MLPPLYDTLGSWSPPFLVILMILKFLMSRVILTILDFFHSPAPAHRT
jgi:hypothetical protein